MSDETLRQKLRRRSRSMVSPLHRLGRALYWRLPYRVRTPLVRWGYRNLGLVFAGLPEYEQWKRADAQNLRLVSDDDQLLDLASTPRAAEPGGRIAIQLHLYYDDLADELAGYLRNMPFAYDLFVSVASAEGERAARRSFASLPHCAQLTIERVANRGRDLAPVFATFGERLARYDFVAHLHGKKSLYNQSAVGWRAYLCEGLFGSEERIRKIFTLLRDSHGLVYPQNSALVTYIANSWLGNRALGEAWCKRLGIEAPRGYFDFPVGSMFWARVSALRPLLTAGLAPGDFPVEEKQTDGTLAHCLERMLGLCARKQGHRIGIVRDEQTPSWSAWRFDQYTNRSEATLLNQLAAPPIRLIAFDIFDTLLSRPLLDPDSTKKIVAARSKDGARYLEHRAQAEDEARQIAGRDIGLDEIYARLAERTDLSPSSIAALRQLEESVERASLRPRPQAIALYRRALSLGRPVVLITDMFLPRALIEHSLHEHGVDGWQALYLSNELGLRKDTGQLYRHVLAEHVLAPSQLIMVGDNERSDVQIPWDLGAQAIHAMRPVELARGWPRARRLVAEVEGGTLDHQLTLGLLLSHGYAGLHDFPIGPDALVDPTPFNLGYALVGPLVTSFAAWLKERALADRIDRLYFVAREGQLLKRVYEAWTESDETPQLDYLVVSRRALGVPMLATRDDIIALAKATYYENTVEEFLWSRFGLRLSPERWAELAQQTKWAARRRVEVHEDHIAPLVPLLAALEPEIFATAAEERAALTRYLEQMRLFEPGRKAVVDIGYGGSMQSHLNGLGAAVNGYYVMTDERAAGVAEQHGVFLRGCFLENVPRGEAAPLFYRGYFSLEKLLSASEGQVIRYRLDGPRAIAEHHALSIEEQRHATSRAQLQEGVMAYAHDARRLRRDLLPSFAPSSTVARRIFEAFIAQPSEAERAALEAITLDDHYCGRGLIRSTNDLARRT